MLLRAVFTRLLGLFVVFVWTQHHMAYIARTLKKLLIFLRFLGYSQHLLFCQVKVQLGPNLALFWKGFGVQVGAKILKKSILTCIGKLIDFLIDFVWVSGRS